MAYRVRPSAAYRWGRGGCTASTEMVLRYPDASGEAAEEGKRLHGLAADVISGGIRLDQLTAGDREVIEPYIRQIQADTYDIRDELSDNRRYCVEGYIPEIGPIGADELPHVAIETPVPSANGVPGGTPDAYLIDSYNKWVYIWDLKTGYSPLSAKHGKDQMICYAKALAPEGYRVKITVVQPRGVGLLSWELTPEALDIVSKKYIDAFAQIQSGNTKFKTGHHCRYCNALVHCPAARGQTMSDAEWLAEQPWSELDNGGKVHELRVLEAAEVLISIRKAALETDLTKKLETGERIPGVRLQPGRGRPARWRDTEKASIVLREFLGDESLKIHPMSPHQALQRGCPESLVNALSKRPDPTTKLKIVDPTEAAKQFEEHIK